MVVKPTDSAGSDGMFDTFMGIEKFSILNSTLTKPSIPFDTGVKLCHNFEEAKEHFNHLFEVEGEYLLSSFHYVSNYSSTG